MIRNSRYGVIKNTKNRILNLTTALVLAVAGMSGATPLFLSQKAAAATHAHYFVRTNGNDVNCDGTANTPNTGAPGSSCAKQTIEAALAVASANDIITVTNGTYTANNINVNIPITLKGKAGTVLNVPNVTETNAFNVFADDVTIDGFTIVGPANGTSYKDYAWGGTVTRGIFVRNGAHNFTLTNNTIQGLRNNILIDGRNTGVVTGNTIDNSKSGISVQYTDAGTGNTEGFTVTITGNQEGTFGNEWGINTHLNGHYDDATTSSGYHPNGDKIAASAPTSVQSALLANSAANGNWTAQDQGYSYSNRTATFVGGTGASDANQGSPLGPLATVQMAVNATVENGSVNVASGTYNEDVTVGKALSLKGAQAGVDARTRSGSESAVSSFVVTKSDVTIDGFSLTKAGNQINVAPSPDTGLILSDLVFQNNIFSGYNSVGVTTNNAGNLLVQKNLFKDVVGAGEAMQIRANGAFGDAGCSETQVLDNTFVNASNEGADINFSCTGSGSTDLVVAGNVTSGSTASFTAFSGVSDGIDVHDNTATGIQDNSAIYFFGGVTGSVNVSGNTITGGNAYAVSLSSGIYDGSTPHTGTFTITGNDLSGNARGISVSPNALGTGGTVVAHNNNLSSNTTAGVYNSTSTTLDASANWWGDASGPTGSQYTGDVTVAPWCDVADCTSLFSDQAVQLQAGGGQATTSSDGPLTLSGSTSAGTATAVIPAGTTVTSSDSSWDGTITPPTVSSYHVPGATKTTALAITVGSDSSSLSFDQSVRMALPGQAGKHVGFIAPGSSTFSEITTTCTADNQASADSQLGASGACKMSVGGDLVIWTKHFTTFASYTVASSNNGGGSNSGSGSGGSSNSGSGSSSSNGSSNYPPVFNPTTIGTITGTDTTNDGGGKVLGSENQPNTTTDKTQKSDKDTSSNFLGLGWWWLAVLAALAAVGYLGGVRRRGEQN